MARRRNTRSTPARASTASAPRARPSPAISRGGTPPTARTSASGARAVGGDLERLLRDLGAEVELVQHEVFDGTQKTVAHFRHGPSTVRNVNEEAAQKMSRMDRVAVFITDHVGTMGFFLIIFTWTVLWLLWNSLAPRQLRFDPGPAFVFWLFISNMIQIFLMPLLMVGQNLQGQHSELRAEADFDVNKKAEKEVEIILTHLEHQAAQIERQGELILDILGRVETLAKSRAAGSDGAAASVPASAAATAGTTSG